MADNYYLVYTGIKERLPENRNSNSFYLCTDTKEIYFGANLYSGRPVLFFKSINPNTHRDFPTTPTANTLYIDESDMSGWVWNPDKTPAPAWEQVITSASSSSYQIREVSTSEQAFKTYALFCDGQEVDISDPTQNVVIDIPKSFLIKSASVNTVVAADKAAGGKFENDPEFQIGDKYIDLVVWVRNLVHPPQGSTYDDSVIYFDDPFGLHETDTSGFIVGVTDVTPYYIADSSEESHIYINVKDLVDVYTAGWGLGLGDGETTYDDGSTIIPNNALYAKINNLKRNGLEVTSAGIGLNLAQASYNVYVAASGTAQEGVIYYSDNIGTIANPQPEEGADVSGYYVYDSTVPAIAGAMSGIDKDHLDELYYAFQIGAI